MSEKIVQLNEEVIKCQIKELDGRGDYVPADGGHGWQNQQSCLWKQTASGRTPGQGQRTGRAVSLLGW